MCGLFIHLYTCTYVYFGERNFMTYTYFCLQRIFLCYMQNYPTYIHIWQGMFATYLTCIHICKAFLLPIQHIYIFATHLTYIHNWPTAIPYNPSIQQIKHESKHELLHKICQTQTTRALRYINGEPKNQGIVHLLVGKNQNTTNGGLGLQNS